jgi:hypothetical protein
VFAPEFGPLVELLGNMREDIIRSINDDSAKKEMLSGLIDRQAMQLMLEGKFDLAKERITSAYHSGGSKS